MAGEPENGRRILRGFRVFRASATSRGNVRTKLVRRSIREAIIKAEPFVSRMPNITLFDLRPEKSSRRSGAPDGVPHVYNILTRMRRRRVTSSVGWCGQRRSADLASFGSATDGW